MPALRERSDVSAFLRLACETSNTSTAFSASSASSLVGPLERLVESAFLEEFVLGELESLGNDNSHTIAGAAGQVSLVAISEAHVEYTIRIVFPQAVQSTYIQWTGAHIVAVVEPSAGPLEFDIFDVPDEVSINSFQRDISARLSKRGVLDSSSKSLQCGCRQFFELRAFAQPAVVHLLTLKDPESTIRWSFDRSLRSVFSEDSSLARSRLLNIFDTLRSMGSAIPDVLVSHALAEGDARLLKRITAYLLSQHDPKAFQVLHKMSGSNHPAVAQMVEKIVLGESGAA